MNISNNPMLLVELKQHSGKLFGLWAAGMTTWFVEVDKWIARIGLWAGALAAIMLIVIRWDDAMKSGPIVRWRERLARWLAALKQKFQ